jgi:hypothetical protein
MCFICVSDESDEDDEDDEAALILELEQIRKERAEEKLRMVSLRGLYSLFMSHYAIESLGCVWALLVEAHELAMYNMVVRMLFAGWSKVIAVFWCHTQTPYITESMGVILFRKG